jgi:membrane protein DedA with SNARE-associated domain
VEELIRRLSSLNPFWVYCTVSGVAFIENIFPPFPSDVLVVFAGSLAGLGTIDFTVALILTSLGSTAGFVLMYKIGDWFGLRILETGKLPFIPTDQVHKVERWFRKYGYFLIVANRFLAGTRAIVSFFAGMSELPLLSTSILSFVSALLWNFTLLYAGLKLGENWQVIAFYIATYSKIITLIIAVIALLLIGRYLHRQSRQDKNGRKI